MLMSHFEEPKLTDDEEPPTEQDKRRKQVSFTPAQRSQMLHSPIHDRCHRVAVID
ncbi:hypothetical protein PO909_018208 [Leuciscus waleckii]